MYELVLTVLFDIKVNKYKIANMWYIKIQQCIFHTDHKPHIPWHVFCLASS